ncbi:hypothetical protein HDU79_000342, partial [Rhizoclosmatium sp. JEL0117]
VSDLNVGDSSATTSNVDNFESTGTTPTNLGVQEQDPIISETRGFTLSPFLGSKTPVIAASSAILPTLASVKAVSTIFSIQSDFESVTDGEDGKIDHELLNQFQRLGFNNFSDSDLISASDMDSVGGLEELLNGISSLNMDSFDPVNLFELEQNLADLDLGYGTAPFISAAGKGKGAKKAKESKPAQKSVKRKAATAKSAKGKGKRAMEDDDADDVDEDPPSDPVPMESLSLTCVKVPQGSIYVDGSTSFIPNTLRPCYCLFARAYDRFLSTSQSLLTCQAFLDTIDSMTIHEALASFESQFGFIHPAGSALIAIRNRIISVRRHNAENNLEGETQFSIVPQLYKCPQGMIDGLDHCSCFTGDWSYSINQATFNVLQETHAATVFPLSGSSEQLRKELDDTCLVCLQDGYCQNLIRHMIESHPNYEPAVTAVPTVPIAPVAPVVPVAHVASVAPVAPVALVAQFPISNNSFAPHGERVASKTLFHFSVVHKT